MNFWNKLMGSEDSAGEYMLSYGEGPGSDTRLIIAELVKPDQSVLDVGCGPGWNMEHFANYGPALSAYKGVDYADFFVNAANKRRKFNVAEDFSTIKILPFEVQDCRDLKEPDNSWDVVIVQDCVEHTNGYEKPVKEALRVARKRVIVTFWHLTENDDHINDDGDDGYGAWYSKPEWENFLKSLGCKWGWSHTRPEDNRQHDFYYIDKKVK